ncbi:alpha/beta fold hydrolase [Hyphomicrobium facile]|uniref:Lysophospholipase, alpha-beta hydrolase superfamily n=1 Tax=Hyphomicrobium facile TaxID=51670 RepID=A0A1I7NJL3_9HYPH|nr:alpha/beta fold hydrolase [Hyphomicrobium facile]SFV34830.1 Lysophospholipase, alpha-beta hydrolase superfamily [Hyphomicrobium facile]
MTIVRNFVMASACALASAIAALAVTAGEIPQGPAGDAFYTPPSNLPDGERGSLIYARALDGTMALPSAARNSLVLYRSLDQNGKSTAVSGTVSIPKGEPPEGGWPVITWTHGTTGLNAICAPSRDNAQGPEHSYIETISHLLDGFVKNGFAVVATDYQGLGIAGFHPFLQGVPTGRNALDMLRAGRILEPDIGKRYVVMGHSQGGQVDLFAAAEGPSYVPGLELQGNVAFAPGSQIAERLAAVMKSAKTELSLPYVLYTLQSYATTDPAIDLKRILSPEAIAHLPDLQEQCMSHALTTGYWSTAIAKDQFVANPDLEPLLKFGAKNEPGALEISAPTLVIQGTDDVTVFPETTNALVRQMCAGGNVVEYKIFAGADHNGSMVMGGATAEEWIKARFAGKPAGNDCATLIKSAAE